MHIIIGYGTAKDEGKTRKCWEKGAMAGCPNSRFNLAGLENNARIFDRAVRHRLIGAHFGDTRAVNFIKKSTSKDMQQGINMPKLLEVISNIWIKYGVNRVIGLRHSVLSTSI